MSRVKHAAVGAALLVSSLLPLAALAKSIAYYAEGDGSSSAFLIDWQQGDKARLVNGNGASNGTVATDGANRLITLNQPISYTTGSWDDCGEEILLRQDTKQVLVRDLTGGTSEFVSLGTFTNIGGCHDGLVEPFGSLTEEGFPLKRLPMKARPPVTDIVAGLQIAGFSQDEDPGEFRSLAQDVVTVEAGGLKFQANGNVVPAAFNANQWLVLNLPLGQRAYTRLEVSSRTGGEVWLRADWLNGKAQRVEEVLMVKPTAGAGFGTVAQTSRMWESGLFHASQNPFFFHLYRDSTGERVKKNLDVGDEERTPITWGFVGANVHTYRDFNSDATGDRTWVPLANVGKFRWVLESETFNDGSGDVVLIEPRVNYYEDTGKAVPPAK